MKNKARTLQVAIGTQSGPADISTAFGVIPGIDSVLILGSKTLGERLRTDTMSFLKGKRKGW